MVNRCKLVAVGDYCGKTFIIQTFLKDELPEPQLTFVNWDITDVEINGILVELHIWDTCEIERYQPSRISTYNGANVFLIFFSIYCRQTLENVKTKWVPEVRKHGPKNVPIVLVGTHCNDFMMTNKGCPIEEEAIDAMVQEVGAFGFVECAADYKYNLEKVFETAVAAALYEQVGREGVVIIGGVSDNASDRMAWLNAMTRRCKLVAVGDICGKTFVIRTFVKDELPEPNPPNMLNVEYADIQVDGTMFKLRIFDFSDKQVIRSVRVRYYDDTDVFLIFFSIYGRNTFRNVKTKWVSEVREHGPKDVPILLVGTQSRQLRLFNHETTNDFVRPEEIELMVREVGAIGFVECCADNKHNVEKVFEVAVAATLGEIEIGVEP